jgi:hypothetical protein
VKNDPGPLYQLCVDPECPYDFAYRFDGTAVGHYHYIGPPTLVLRGDPDQEPPVG